MVFMKIKTIKLEEAASMCAPYVDPSREDYDAYNAYAAMPLLAMPQFPEFAAWYFSQEDFFSKAEEALRVDKYNNLASTDANDMSLYSFFAGEGDEVNRISLGYTYSTFGVRSTSKMKVRPQEEFPLNIGEIKKGLEFIDRNSEFLLSMVAIKMCVVDYFEALRKEISVEYAVDVADDSYGPFDTVSLRYFRKGFRRALLNAKGASFIQDMTTIMASVMETCDEKSLHRGVHQCFAKGAFESVSREGEYNKCPFSAATSKILQMTFDRNDQGGLVPVEGKRPGALIMWVRDRIQKEFMHSLPDNHPVYSV